MATGAARKTSALPREDVIRATAVRLFHEKGYEATTMRELAREVGIEAPSLYNHFPSKYELLSDILIGSMEHLVGDIRAALAEASSDPRERLQVAIGAYVRFHEAYLGEASISDTERRALKPKESRRLVALRRELGDLFREVIRDGVDAGAFVTEDVSIATISVLSICARLPVWYRNDGRLDLPEVAERFERFALRALGAGTDARPRRDGRKRT